MNVLVVGGTRFVGRHITEALIAAGARVTLFNRGTAYGAGTAGVQSVFGDRLRDLHRLGERTWDAVIDTCAYTPVEMQIAARFFAGKTGAYALISTISVYSAADGAAIDEDSPVFALSSDMDRTRMTGETYGALKAECERIVRSTFRGRALIFRPGLVAGPYDPTDRFTYWPLRIAQGGTVLLPDSPEHPVQYVDARDLAQFVVYTLQTARFGTLNVVTTPGTLTFGGLFEACARAGHVAAQACYVNEQHLLDLGVRPWADLPLWIPVHLPEIAIVQASNARARVAGLHLRPAVETASAVLAWARSAGKRCSTLSAGLSAEREREALR